MAHGKNILEVMPEKHPEIYFQCVVKLALANRPSFTRLADLIDGTRLKISWRSLRSVSVRKAGGFSKTFCAK
jgi:hypothetical protein